MNEDKATRYHRLKRRVAVMSWTWGVALLAALLLSGLTRSLRDAAEGLSAFIGGPLSGNAGATVVAYVVLLSLLNEIVSLPLAFYGAFVLEHRYELSNQRLGRWMMDEGKSFGIGLSFASIGVAIVYALIRLWPDRWWLAAAPLFGLIIVGLANVAPVVLLPLFYRVSPLERESLRRRLLALADRAGARVLGAYEWGLGEKTKKANAALAGLGRTRRILISDTMLREYSDEEIEVVLAHELGHHVHGDIWKGIVLESGLILAGFYLASRLLRAFAGPLGLRSVADPAGLPLMLLAAGAVSLLMVPAAHALSRAFERRADRFAIDLTRNPAAFVSAMRRIGAQNLAEERPSRLVTWLFYSHPPIAERIEAARAASGRGERA